eukprot:1737470-Rhodomonas_salina.2
MALRGDGNEAAFKAACATHATQIAAAWLVNYVPTCTVQLGQVLTWKDGMVSGADCQTWLTYCRWIPQRHRQVPICLVCDVHVLCNVQH